MYPPSNINNINTAEIDKIIEDYNTLHKSKVVSTKKLLELARIDSQKNANSVLKEFPNFPESVIVADLDEDVSDDDNDDRKENFISYCKYSESDFKINNLRNTYSKIEGINVFDIWNLYTQEFQKTIEDTWDQHQKDIFTKKLEELPQYPLA